MDEAPQQLGRTLTVHPWMVIEHGYKPEHTQKHETIFSLGNGNLGLRGSLEERRTDPHSTRGAYINGIYDYYPYVYNWRRPGYPPRGHSMLNVADYNIIEICVDDDVFSLDTGVVVSHERVLDMQRGVLKRTVEWISPSKARVLIEIEKFVSMSSPDIVAVRCSVIPLERSARVQITCTVDGNVKNANWQERALDVTETGGTGRVVHLAHRTRQSGFSIAYAASVVTRTGTEVKPAIENESASLAVNTNASAQEPAVVDWFVALADSRSLPTNQLVSESTTRVENAVRIGFDTLLQQHSTWWSDFWNDADLQIEGDDAAQQGVRYALYQLAQSTGRDGKANCGANGLTGEAYNGHVFWDSEMYIMPAFLYSRPEIARSMMAYRHSILPEARKRAKELEHEGACFSWESISGEECGWIFEAATDQYHLQSDIAYGVIKYHEATGDDEFMLQMGAEIIFETARCMAHRGAFIPLKENKFCINVVCGPDEYTPAVDNNAYTNCMCKFHLEYAYNLAHQMAGTAPAVYKELADRLAIDDVELDLWKRAAQNMYIPYDGTLGITPQDDQFLYRDPVDVEELRKRGYILMNMHPLNLWRFQVAKQADVVLLNLVLPNWFPTDLKKANFDYYEPRTIHDSSLSPSIHSIMASELGYREMAYEYFTRTARMDLDDVKGNTSGGAHTACMGGSWMTIVYGFGGMRVYDGRVHLNPYVPKSWKSYSFKVLFRGAQMRVRVTEDALELNLVRGDSFELEIGGVPVLLNAENPVYNRRLQNP